MKEIQRIEYPNTAIDSEIGVFKVGQNCDEIRRIAKNGEMALIEWFEVSKEDEVIAEIKESVCNIYYY